jgi:hypothetical protein
MKRLLAAAIITALPLSISAETNGGAVDMQANIDQSKMAIKDFFASLKGELVQAMKAGGPVNAIHVCNTRAQTITEVKSQEHGLHIARTSLKVRNPVNAPDEWEAATLKEFEERKAAGEPVAEIVKAEVVTGSDGRKRFRLMKAIPTGKVCLTCHGTDLAPEVSAKLDALYPNDRARGFKLGDIRGAFTVSKEM